MLRVIEDDIGEEDDVEPVPVKRLEQRAHAATPGLPDGVGASLVIGANVVLDVADELWVVIVGDDRLSRETQSQSEFLGEEEAHRSIQSGYKIQQDGWARLTTAAPRRAATRPGRPPPAPSSTTVFPRTMSTLFSMYCESWRAEG